MAEPPAGSPLSADLLRCDPHQGARRRDGEKQGGLCRARRPPGRDEGNPLDRTDRGRQILAPRHERAEEPRRRGRADRHRRWPEGLPGSDHRRLSAGAGADLCRPSHPPLAGLRLVQGSQGGCRGIEANLQGQGRRCGKLALDDFAEGAWGKKYPAIAQSWRRNWSEVTPFFAFPDDVRRIIYTTNSIESLNAKLRRAVRTRGHFPTDESALKLLFLVLNLAAKEWKMPSREWSMAKAQLAILFEDRFTLA